MILEVRAQLLGESGEPLIAYFHQHVVVPNGDPPQQALSVSQQILDRCDECKESIGGQLADLHKLIGS